MKKLFSVALMALMLISVVPMAFAVSVGTGADIDIETEDFEPLVWLCDNRVVLDDATEPGRMTPDGTPLWERMNNYAFEGEQINWRVLVMDKNGIEKIEDVYATVDEDIEVNCQEVHTIPDGATIPDYCNAMILEEDITTFDDDMMAVYDCTLTVETADSMYGEAFITVEAIDLDGLSGTMAEAEYWFLNPVIALSLEGDIAFEDVRPGTSSYSEPILIGNDADSGSGVRMDMFISGTDFYDTSSSGAMCPTTNQLALNRFAYYATHGAYSTGGIWPDPRADAEGYVGIGYGIGFNDPVPFYNTHEIMQAGPMNFAYYQANILSPGSEMALIFRLNLPEPCNGDFDSGQIYFWGEAI